MGIDTKEVEPTEGVLAVLMRLRSDGGDRDWDDLFAKVRGPLRAACGKRLHDPALIDDAIQETVLAVRRRLTCFAASTDAEAWAWLRAIASNISCNLVTRGWMARRRGLEASHDEVLAGSDCAEDAREAHDDRLEQVRSALQTLQPRQRQLIELRYFQARDIPTIASDLGLTRGTVEVTLSQALVSLRSTLARSVDGTSLSLAAIHALLSACEKQIGNSSAAAKSAPLVAASSVRMLVGAGLTAVGALFSVMLALNGSKSGIDGTDQRETSNQIRAAEQLATISRRTTVTSVTVIQGVDRNGISSQHPMPVGTSLTVSIPGTSLTAKELLATCAITNRTDKALDFQMMCQVEFSLQSFDHKTNYKLAHFTNGWPGHVLDSAPFGLGPKGVFTFTAGFGTPGARIFETTTGADGKMKGRFISHTEVKKGPYHLRVQGNLLRLYPGSTVSGAGTDGAFSTDIAIE